MKNTLLILLTIIAFIACQNSNRTPITLPTTIAEIGEVLDSIHIEDQQYRQQIQLIVDEHGRDSKEMRSHWKKIRQTDQSNLRVVEEILDKHGWLSSDQVGRRANSTLFLVIQHADQRTQEKYLPLMREAVNQGNAQGQSLALLEDRVALGKGELQIYGSQIGTDQKTGNMYVLPLVNPETVNERRAEVGLGPIEDYISHWDLEWDVDKYKEEIAKYN